jgi:hypothetical protein
VRTRLGLPQRSDGRSVEYQAYIDSWKWELALQALLLGLARVRTVLELLGVADRYFVLTINEARVLEVLTSGGRIPLGEGALVVRPALGEAVEVGLSPGALSSPQAAALLGRYVGAGKSLKAAAFKSAAWKDSYNAMRDASGEMGMFSAREFMVMDDGLRLTANEIICCPGLPTSGGGATGVFDWVGERIIGTDPVTGEALTKIIIVEAKGGLRWFSLFTKQEGRYITLPDGTARYALKGSREYVEAVADEMRLSSNPMVRDTGLKVLAKIRSNAWNTELEYFFATSRWLRQGRTTIGINPVMRVQRVFW